MESKGPTSKKSQPELAILSPTAPVKTAGERVLVFPASIAQAGWGFADRPLIRDRQAIEDYLDEVFRFENLKYIDRKVAEADTNWLQIIPYVVIFRGREVFCYQRSKDGGEKRLHDKWSLGIGGHINPIDGEGSPETYWAAFRRELKEETGLNTSTVPVTGLIYDPSNDVGKVHFGVVHHLQLGNNPPPMEFRDKGIVNGQFLHVTELPARAGEFENWSRLVITQLL